MNRIIKGLLSNVLFAALIVSVISIPVIAAEGGEEPVNRPVAEEMIGPYGISFSPTVGYKQLTLTVSFPNGEVFQRTFDAGTTPRFSLGDTAGALVTDGLYTYELRVIPFTENVDRNVGDKPAAMSKASLVQSGHFMVKNGGVIPKSGDEPHISLPQPPQDLATTSDICYVDDLIVDGSLCVGFDCVCNYSFGFDTIVLKENNLRIFFDDTSNSASFPNNDWRIVINDSSNGGAEYFGVEDSTAGRRVFTLEAGAPSHSLYVDDGGRIGNGTSTPVTDIHTVSGNTPTLRLEQDGSSGFTPQTWDVAGNEANFFVRDATNGSKIPFKIKPSAPTNSLVVAANGDIGIGTQSPSERLHMATDSSTNAKILLVKSSGATGQVTASTSNVQIGAASNHPVRIVSNGAQKMEITAAGDVNMAVGGGSYDSGTGAWVDGSSREYKKNIVELKTDAALAALKDLKPVTFQFKADKNNELKVGFIAEDVPELVATYNRKGLSALDIVAVLTKVVQQQQTLSQQQQETISELKKRVAELEKTSK
jgi:hypothetical protein